MDPFAGLAARLAMVAAIGNRVHDLLEEAASLVEDRAKGKLGSYQPAVGPYPAWQPLSPVTQEIRAAQGYTPNDPLLRSGEMAESISHVVYGEEAAVGTTSEKAVWQELGTATIPPRPFFGPVAIETEPEVQRIISASLVRFVR